MAKTTRQTAIFGVEDWKQIYQTYREADFQSYDFETLRKSFVDYLRLYYPETFNDYIESSEYIALLDVMAFMGQALAFRTDLNTRENYLDTAERRDSVVKLSNLVSYTAKRNTASQGLLKVFNITTTENVVDYNGVNLSNITINWADPTNPDWLEQWNAIINACLVDTQKIGRPGNKQTVLDVITSEYSINLVPGFLPVIPYTATVNGISMPFEAMTASTVGKDYIYEPSPVPNTVFNMLYRNDQKGYLSADNGYFFLFKQGTLQNQDFNLTERIANRTVNINIEGVNNEDRWLFQLDNLGNISREWAYSENIYSAAAEQLTTLRPIYSVTSRTNDQITMVFGDGVFSEIPVGIFRAYVRSSNGLQYIINPEEMQNVVLPISYIDRTGNLQTITFTCGITKPVTNAQARESIDSIKQRAPARYYTQNRMVNGEDYNLFPYTQYNSIIKSKAVARASIGTSRYLDLVDNTGKYSSTNTFGSDGALWEDNILPTVLFSWTNRNQISDFIVNEIQPNLVAATSKQFYYANFPRKSLVAIPATSIEVGSSYTIVSLGNTNFTLIGAAVNAVGISFTATGVGLGTGTVYLTADVPAIATTWHQSTTLVNETTGYFQNSTGAPVPVGDNSSNVLKYAVVRSLIKFVAPAGYYFDENNRLKLGSPTLPGDHSFIWASPTAIVGDSYNNGAGNLSSGQGPVTLNNFVPTGAIVETIIPVYTTTLSTAVQQEILQQVLLGRNFGLGYDNDGSVPTSDGAGTWYLITNTNLDVDAPWSQEYAGNTSGHMLDASWVAQATILNGNYTVTFRGLAYYFGSVLQTRFFWYGNQKIYDGRTGTTIKDFVNIMAVNTQPDSNYPLSGDVYTTIIGQPVESDGYIDDFQVLISYRDSDSDGVPDNPDFFQEVVGVYGVPTSYTAASPWVFMQRIVDFDNLQRYVLVEPGVVNSQYATYDDIEFVKFQYSPGQYFYAYSQGIFWLLSINSAGVLVLTQQTEGSWMAKTGRPGLYFQYRHNAPLSTRIDPGTSNIIDIYLVTLSYYSAYQNWLRDTTGTVPEPAVPTIDELSTAYQGLQDYKMISDTMVMNSVAFKPLFGPKAASALQATIKVIRAQNSVASTSEIKSSVLTAMNEYFSIDKWGFGDTFYFSELAAYLHRQLGTIISSVVIVPLNTQKYFGDLYEIRAEPNEIFANAATVDNIEVIEALTSTNLRTAPGSGVI